MTLPTCEERLARCTAEGHPDLKIWRLRLRHVLYTRWLCTFCCRSFLPVKTGRMA